MKRILHLSDLHFGRVNQTALAALQQIVLEQDPGFDLIIMTGDWTQRAKVREFAEASDFIRSLTSPVLSVPGNHDVPLYDLGRRFFAPYSRYAKLRPLTLSHFQDEDVSVVGLSTVNPYRPVAGVVHESDVERARSIFEESAATAIRILACHHPIFDPSRNVWLSPENRSQALLRLQPDIILSGHSHMQWVEMSEFNQKSVLHVSAGTTISSRVRDEVNSFHILELGGSRTVIVKTYDLADDGFLERGMPAKKFNF